MTETAQKETVLINLSFGLLDKTILSPLRTASSEIETLSMHLRNATGAFEGTGWEARLESPPSFAEIGAVAILLERVAAEVAEIKQAAAEIEASLGDLDSMRLEGWTRASGR